MIKYKEGVNVLELLKGLGFSTYILRERQIFGQSTIQKLRSGGLPSWKELDFICDVLACDVGDILEFKRDCR